LRQASWCGDIFCAVAHVELDTNMHPALPLALIVRFVTLISVALALLVNAQRRRSLVPFDLCWYWFDGAGDEGIV
jgi:hypothetical protein